MSDPKCLNCGSRRQPIGCVDSRDCWECYTCAIIVHVCKRERLRAFADALGTLLRDQSWWRGVAVMADHISLRVAPGTLPTGAVQLVIEERGVAVAHPEVGLSPEATRALSGEPIEKLIARHVETAKSVGDIIPYVPAVGVRVARCAHTPLTIFVHEVSDPLFIDGESVAWFYLCDACERVWPKTKLVGFSVSEWSQTDAERIRATFGLPPAGLA